MHLPEFCIKRPVFTVVLSLVLMVVGVISLKQLPIQQLPNITMPVISIMTDYPGADPKLVENQLTQPMENLLAGINGIDVMESTSSFSSSNINLRFQMGVDIQDKLSEVRDKLMMAKKFLPAEVESPLAKKTDSGVNPIMFIGFFGDKQTSLQLTDYVTRNVVPRVQQVEGVAQVFVWGRQVYAVRVNLDPQKMAGRGIAITDIRDALAKQNIDVPSGQLKSASRNYALQTDVRLTSPDEFKSIVVSTKNGYLTRLSDIASIKIAAEDADYAMRVNGKPGVAIAIVPQTDANPVAVSASVAKILPDIQANLPESVHLKVLFDAAVYIKQAIAEIFKSLFESTILVLIVVVLFLGNWRSALIPIVTIPICLIAVCWPLAWLGYSLNMLTLLALVLAIGLVVDDAIVMLENIYRYIELGLSPLEAALKGSREIVFAVIGMTITLLAVYAPLGFDQGLTGVLFRQFGFTLAAAVLLSGFVALTLSPMMSAHLLKAGKKGVFQQKVDQLFSRLLSQYQSALRVVLTKSWTVMGIFLGLLIVGILVFKTLPAELAPPEDQGYVMGIIKTPPNSSFTYTDRYAKQIEAIYDQVKVKQNYLMSVQDKSAFSLITLKPWDERTDTAETVTASLQEKFRHITGVMAYPFNPNTLSGRRGGGNHGFGVVISSPVDYSVLGEILQSVQAALAKTPGLTNVDSDLDVNTTQYDIQIDRNRAAMLQVNLTEIGSTLSTLFGGSQISTFVYDGLSYKVMAQLEDNQLRDLKTLNDIYVRNSSGLMIPLNNLVKIQPKLGPSTLPHYNQFRSATITAEIRPGYSIGDVVKSAQSILQQVVPDNAKYSFTGAARDYLESQGSSGILFLLALLFIYLVLAAQFESFVDPFIILLTVPVAIVGALVTLKIFGASLSIYSMLGLVTLIGLITKQGILITEFANHCRAEGQSILEAVITASSLRLRPILMTTSAMVLGAMPLAIATGAGSASREHLGLVLVGGLSAGSLFSLFVIPSAYFLVNTFRLKKKKGLVYEF